MLNKEWKFLYSLLFQKGFDRLPFFFFVGAQTGYWHTGLERNHKKSVENVKEQSSVFSIFLRLTGLQLYSTDVYYSLSFDAQCMCHAMINFLHKRQYSIKSLGKLTVIVPVSACTTYANFSQTQPDLWSSDFLCNFCKVSINLQ